MKEIIKIITAPWSKRNFEACHELWPVVQKISCLQDFPSKEYIYVGMGQNATNAPFPVMGKGEKKWFGARGNKETRHYCAKRSDVFPPKDPKDCLPEGAVFLGKPGEFQLTPDHFDGWAYIREELEPCWVHYNCLHGDEPVWFYAAPADSEIVRLNTRTNKESCGAESCSHRLTKGSEVSLRNGGISYSEGYTWWHCSCGWKRMFRRQDDAILAHYDHVLDAMGH